MVFSIFKKVLILFLFFQQLIVAGPDQELFLQANLKYEEQDFESALKLYDAMTKKGSAVWFNMALSAYYLKKPAQSLSYLLRARQQATVSNYWKIQSQIKQIDQSENGLLNTIFEYFGFITILFSTMTFQCFLILILLSLSFLIGWYRFTRKYLLACLLIIFTFDLALLRQKNNNRKQCVVYENGAIVYVGPSTIFNQKLMLAPLSIVSVLQEKESWYKVRYGKTIGWLESQAVCV